MVEFLNASELRTRKQLIDPRLRAAGWEIVPFEPARPLSVLSHHAVEEYPTANGPADYALFLDGQLVGVVEAKRRSVDPHGVLVQAERYAQGISDAAHNFRGFRVPFLNATNGELVLYHDVRHPLEVSRTVAGFHTPDALRELLARDFDHACSALQATANNHPRLRPYQIEANAAAERAIAERRRNMLIAMATGTGKTFTTVNQTYRLMKAGVAKRILFLVDRRALAAQAVRAFASFEPEPGLKFDKLYEVYSQRFQSADFGEEEKFDPQVLPRHYLTNPTSGLAFVYVCTIQRMAINLFGRQALVELGDDEEADDDADQIPIPIHAFDLIVADECHRGYTTAQISAWRKTLDHFDAIRIGLTATPAAHTKAYFKEVVFRYEYDRAVREGHLVDYDVVKLRSNVRMEGMFLKEGEQVDLIDPDSGSDRRDFLEDERAYETTEIERKVTSPDSNRKIIEELKRYALEHEQRTGRFPKTLIFAANDLPHVSHADQLVECCRDVFGRGEAFVRKITGRVDRPLQRIREFRNRKEPGIVVTVDLLSTGVDIPDLEFIVFLRPVKSRILFEQMLGRGTRKGEHHPDKTHFVVFDCFDGTLLQYFKKTTGLTADPPSEPSRTVRQIIEDVWQNRDREFNTRCLVKRLQRIEKNMSGDARDAFARFIPEGDIGGYATRLAGRLKQNFPAEMQLLRNSDFQDLLENYPRKRDPFLIALEHEDAVTSEYLLRDAAGKEYKPEDYLTAFARYIQDHAADIDAIEILLSRPADWRTGALVELRDRLKTAPEHFTVDNLQRAHQSRYKKALVEIISMVKHAADEQQPLLTAEERVEKAFTAVMAGRTFTDEQRQWLDRIRSHLIANLSIDPEDFDLVPVLEQAGGWGKANRVFEGMLEDLIRTINRAIAA
jgi:type I restriction enzyme R subunit